MLKNKRTSYLLLTSLIIGTILLISVGLSIWLITDKVEIKPEFNSGIIVEYLDSKETTYNGNIQLPSANALDIDDDILEYRYKLEGEDTYKVVDREDSDETLDGPINAGDYLLEVLYNAYSYVDENGETQTTEIVVSGITFKINPKPISDIEINAYFTNNQDASFYYTSLGITEIEETFKVKYNEKELEKGADYSVSFSEIIEIGNSHTATITGNNNFTGTKTVTYKILPSTLEIVISDEVETVVVNGVTYYVFEFGKYNNDNFPINDWITVQTSNGLIIENSTVNYYYYKGLNGTYGQNQLDLASTTLDIGYYGFKITAGANGFSSVEKEIKVQIKKLDISSAVVTILESFMYDGTAHTPEIDSIVCSNGTKVNLSELSLGSVTYSNNVDATSTAIKAKAYITGSGNYEGTAVGDFSITKRPSYIDGVLSFTFTTPTSCSKTKFVEGEDISEFITGNPTATLNGVELSGKIVPVLEYPENSTNANEVVKIKYRYSPQKNSNGEYNVEETEVESTMSITLYAVAYNSISKIYYGTIKKAIGDADSTNNKVWVVPYDYDSVGYYPTIVEDITINSNITFGLAYMIKDGVVTEYKYFNDGDSYAAADSEANPSKLIINEGVTLTINSKATFTIGAFVGDAGVVSKASVVMNNGNIIVESSGVVNSYGFTKGNGTFYVKEGATVYDVLRIYDFAGARYAGGMYYKTYKKDGNITPDRLNNILPFQSYSMHNIACKLYIYTGATFYVRAHLNVSNTIYVKNLTLFGSGGLFQMEKTEGKTENYIIRTVENTESTDDFKNGWNVTNQSIYQKEIYDINTSITDNSLHISISIDVKIAKAALNFNTDENTAMPVGMLDIILRDGHTMHIKTNSWKFLPGSGIYIDKGATLKIDSGINVIVYDEYFDNFSQIEESGTVRVPASFSYYQTHTSLYDASTRKVKAQYVAKLYVDGVVDCKGGLAAIIETRGTTGTVVLTASSATLRRLKSIKYLGTLEAAAAAATWQDMGGVVYDDTKSSQMKLYNGQTISEKYTFVAGGEYKAKEGQKGVYGWYSTEVSIEYNLNGGIGTPPATLESLSAEEGYIVTSDDVAKLNPIPTKEAYTYGVVESVEINGEMIEGIYYWALDPQGTQIVIPGQTKLYASAVFYAIWVPTEYNITYVNVYYDSDSTDSNFVENPNPSTYTIESSVFFKNATVYDENGEALLPGGFYTDILCTEEYKIQNIFNSYGDITIYLYWYPSNFEQFTIKYNVTFESVDEISNLCPNDEIGVILKDEIKWEPEDISHYINDDPNKECYFNMWYFDEELTIPYTNSYDVIMDKMEVVDGNKVLRLYTKILPKVIVRYADAPEGFTYTNGKPFDYYAIPGKEIKLEVGSGSVDTDNDAGIKKTYTFNGFKLTNDNKIYNGKATLGTTYSDNLVIITPDVTYSVLYKVSITDGNGYLTSINVSNGDWIPANTTITFTIKKGSKGIIGIGSWYASVAITSANGSFSAKTYDGKKDSATTHTYTFTGGGGINISTSKV